LKVIEGAKSERRCRRVETVNVTVVKAVNADRRLAPGSAAGGFESLVLYLASFI
jgi:hypothetical protein